MSKIFVVGSYNTGLTIRVPRRPALGESLIGDSFDMGPGGKGSNQAIGAARLGADVRLLVCLGDDAFAQDALALYRREGIAARPRPSDRRRQQRHRLRQYPAIGRELDHGRSWRQLADEPRPRSSVRRANRRVRYPDGSIGDSAGDGAVGDANRQGERRAHDPESGAGPASPARASDAMSTF